MNETTARPFHAEFQTFDDPPEAAAAAPRVAALREELARRGLDGFVVPHADRFQNEYLPPSEERLAWLTGFTGSAGAAVILADKAALFVDGRYTTQARDQVDGALFTIEHLVDRPPGAWIEANLQAGQKLGYDPWLHSSEGAERLAKACTAVGAMLVATSPNPIDTIWRDRPAPPHGAVVPHGLEYAGEAAAEKLERIRAEIARLKADALVVSDPHAVAWTFNIRGSDVAHTPVALAFAIIPAEGPARLYVDADRVTAGAKAALAGLAEIRPPATFEADVAALGTAHRTVQLDQASAASAIAQAVTGHGGKAPRGADPIAAMKTIKNDAEIAGSRAAHRRDGAAMVRFLAWFDRTAPKGGLTEIDAVEALETFRRDTESPQGRVVPDHLRLRPERRHRPLPGHPPDQPEDLAGRDLSRRFRRAVRGRHHRHHPHRDRRRADGGDARPLHPRAQRPHRDCPRRVSGRHHRRPARQLRAGAAVGGRPRLRPRHRPRRRQLSLGA